MNAPEAGDFQADDVHSGSPMDQVVLFFAILEKENGARNHFAYLTVRINTYPCAG